MNGWRALVERRFALASAEDIAAVGVRALTEELAEEVSNVSGGDLTSVPEQVGILSAILGRKLECIDLSEEEAVQAKAVYS